VNVARYIWANITTYQTSHEILATASIKRKPLGGRS
jgi:hypothetical protein